jgi:hypothetical protein
VYHGFNDIYKQHFHDAKFHAVKGAEFKSLKERLMFVCHLLKKHPDLPPGKRTKVIQAVLAVAEDDLRHSRNVQPRDHKNKEPGKSSWLTSFLRIVGLFLGPTDEELLGKELKKITSGVTDSDFLLRVKRIDDKDLEAPIRRVVDLACTQLSSSIDAAVMKMTHAVLQMQQDECKGSIQRDIEAKERKELGGLLVKFIRVVNKISARHKTS